MSLLRYMTWPPNTKTIVKILGSSRTFLALLFVREDRRIRKLTTLAGSTKKWGVV